MEGGIRMNKVGFLFLTVLVGVFVLAGCPPPNSLTKGDLTNYSTSGQASGACLDCHTSNYGFIGACAVNQTKYLSSGHANGLRELLTAGGYASNSIDEDSASCSKCHTTDGFVSWTIRPGAISISGTTVPTDIANTSIAVSPDQVTCYACHNPHANWNMDLRVNMAVGLGSGMYGVGTGAITMSSTVFSGGEGNLCANCHQDRTDNTKRSTFFAAMTVGTYYTGTAGVAAVGGSPHHGVQSDVLLSKGSAGYIAPSGANGVPNGYQPAPTFAAATHYGANFKDSTGTSDSCVTCHVTLNTQNATGQVSSHAMYLTNRDAPGGSDNVAVCAVCHNALTGTTVSHNLNTGSTAFRDFVSNSTLLADIDKAKKTLLGFFGNPAFFFNYDSSTASSGPPATPATVTSTYGGKDTATLPNPTHGAVQGGTNVGTPPTTTFTALDGQYIPGATSTSWTWKKDWDFAGTLPSRAATVYMTIKVQQALWNFKIFTEDRSDGIHNPKYAAELLYDAINLINTDTGTGGVATISGWVPLLQPTNWGIRP
jgi:nitrate reductase cytochrome c-type subunit